MDSKVLAQRIYLFNAYVGKKDDSPLFGESNKNLKWISVEREKLTAIILNFYRKAPIDRLFNFELTKEQIRDLLEKN